MATAPYQLDQKNTEPFRAMSMGMRSLDDIKPRADFKTQAPKLSPRDKTTFSSGVVVMRADGNGQDQNITIAVEEYKDFPMGTVLETSGPTWITPYVRDGRMALSVVCEKLVPAKFDDQDAAGLPTFGADK